MTRSRPSQNRAGFYNSKAGFPPSPKEVFCGRSRQVDLLEPIDLAEHLGKVELYLGQVCQIAGISKMQLDYWTNKAQIPTKGKKQRIYDIDALETVMLIKQAKDKGLNLGAAIDARRALPEQKPRSTTAPERSAGRPRPRQRVSRLRGGFFGRDRVDVDPGAELDAGERRQPRDDLEVPAARPGGATRSAGRRPADRVQAASVREQASAARAGRSTRPRPRARGAISGS